MKKKSKILTGSVVAGSLLLMPYSLWAEGRVSDKKDTYERDRSITDGSSQGIESTHPRQRAGRAGTMDTEQPQPEQGAIENGSTPVSKMSDEAKRAVQGELAPHSLMIETSLMSILDEIRGLRAGLKVEQDRTPSTTFIQHFKMLGKEIDEDLKTAKVHENELVAGIQRHPQIARTQEFQSVRTALNDLINVHTNWHSKATQVDYWKNHKAVTDDLDRLESQVKTVIDKTKSFNSKDLDVSNVG